MAKKASSDAGGGCRQDQLIHRGFLWFTQLIGTPKTPLSIRKSQTYTNILFLSWLWVVYDLLQSSRIEISTNYINELGRISIPHGTPTPSNLYLGDQIKSGEIITLAHVSLVFPTALSPTRTHLTNSWCGCSSSILLLQPGMLTIFHFQLSKNH